MTTASAHLAMVEALRDVQRSGVAHNDDLKACKHCNRFQDGKDYPPGHGKDGVAAPDWYDHDWYKKLGVLPPACVIATRALEGWEKRPRLAEDTAVWSGLVAAGLVNAIGLPPTETAALWVRIQDALEPLLFGTGPRTGSDHHG